MIVISDTTPLNYLILIDRAIILNQLYEVVVIPQAVHDELLVDALKVTNYRVSDRLLESFVDKKT